MKQMNGHPYTFDQLQSLVDGTLDKALAGEVGQHLDSCAECRETMAKLRALETKTAQALPVDAPDKYFDTFGSRVSARIAASKVAAPARRAWFAWWGLVPAAAAAVLVLLIALNPEHSLRQQALVREPVRQATKTIPVASPPPDIDWQNNVKRAAAPAAPSSPDEQPTDKPGLRTEEQPAPEEDRTLAAKDEAATPALRASAKSSLRAAPPTETAPATTATGMAETKSKRAAAPAPAVTGLASTTEQQPNQPAAPLPGTGLSCAPMAINQLQVIVIHLPGGKGGCPAPAIVTAIEIVIPADCRSAN